MRKTITTVLRLIMVAVVAVTPVVAPSNAAFAAACTNPDWDPWRYESDFAYTFGRGYEFHRKLSGDGAGELEFRYQWEVGSGWTSWERLGGGVAMRGSPSATRNTDGRVVVFMVTDNGGAIQYKYQLEAGGATFTNWISLGGIGASNPEVALNNDGRIEVFVRGTTRQIYHRWQDLSYNWNPWPDWASLGGDFNSKVKSSLSTDGKIVIEARGQDCFDYSRWQYTPGGNWYPPTWWYQGGYLG